MRLVFDTDVVVAGMRSPSGASAALLQLARRRVVTPVLTVPLAIEYEAVCSREQHRAAAGLSLAEVGSFIDALILVAHHVEVSFRYRPMIRDADDELVLEAAINGAAELIVTFNMSDFGTVPQRFGIRSVRPDSALKEVSNG